MHLHIVYGCLSSNNNGRIEELRKHDPESHKFLLSGPLQTKLASLCLRGRQAFTVVRQGHITLQNTPPKNFRGLPQQRFSFHSGDLAIVGGKGVLLHGISPAPRLRDGPLAQAGK